MCGALFVRGFGVYDRALQVPTLAQVLFPDGDRHSPFAAQDDVGLVFFVFSGLLYGVLPTLDVSRERVNGGQSDFAFNAYALLT